MANDAGERLYAETQQLAAFLHSIGIADSVESVSLNAIFLLPVIRHRISRCDLRNCAVKCRVEYCHLLAGTAKHFVCGFYAEQVELVVDGSKLFKLLYVLLNCIADQHTGSVSSAAVYDSVDCCSDVCRTTL